MRISEQPLLAQRVHDGTLLIVGELAPYGIVAAALAAFQAQIAAVRAMIDASRSGMAMRVASRGELVRLFRAGDRLMREIDGVMLPLRATNAELHDEYLATRQVLDRRGARSTGEGETPPGEMPAALSAATASAPPLALAA